MFRINIGVFTKLSKKTEKQRAVESKQQDEKKHAQKLFFSSYQFSPHEVNLFN